MQDSCNSPTTKSNPTLFEIQPIRIDYFGTAMSIRIACSETAMEAYGSEQWSGDSSTYMTAGQMCLRSLMVFQETSSSVFLRIVKAILGWPALEDSTGFESSPSRRFLLSKVCLAMLLSPCLQPKMEAFGLALTRA